MGKITLVLVSVLQQYRHNQPINTLAFASQKYPIGLLCHVTSPTPTQWRPVLRFNSLCCTGNIKASFLVNKDLYISNNQKSILELIKPIFAHHCCCSLMKITSLRDPLVSIFRFTLISDLNKSLMLREGRVRHIQILGFDLGFPPEVLIWKRGDTKFSNFTILLWLNTNDILAKQSLIFF